MQLKGGGKSNGADLIKPVDELPEQEKGEKKILQGVVCELR